MDSERIGKSFEYDTMSLVDCLTYVDIPFEQESPTMKNKVN